MVSQGLPQKSVKQFISAMINFHEFHEIIIVGDFPNSFINYKHLHLVSVSVMVAASEVSTCDCFPKAHNDLLHPQEIFGSCTGGSLSLYIEYQLSNHCCYTLIPFGALKVFKGLSVCVHTVMVIFPMIGLIDKKRCLIRLPWMGLFTIEVRHSLR